MFFRYIRDAQRNPYGCVCIREDGYIGWSFRNPKETRSFDRALARKIAEGRAASTTSAVSQRIADDWWLVDVGNQLFRSHKDRLSAVIDTVWQHQTWLTRPREVTAFNVLGTSTDRISSSKLGNCNLKPNVSEVEKNV